jgi:hypothetical protein
MSKKLNPFQEKGEKKSQESFSGEGRKEAQEN